MSLQARNTIVAKRNGKELSGEEIADLIRGYCQGNVPDYQMSAFLMAVYFSGMSTQETHSLLTSMMESGETLEWTADSSRPCVDKHSTGGVGDKTSFLVLPLLLCAGCSVPMIAGRGLGHTGGTLDKAESLPGLSTALSKEDMHRSMKELNGFLAGQTANFVPADGKLYALRDVTGTIESTPLIVSSILSKKLAAGARSLVFDVKFGNGAFMRDAEQARQLAEALSQTADTFGARVTCALSGMDEPLGDSAGNALEINECLDLLEARTHNETLDLSVDLAAALLDSLEGTPTSTGHAEHRKKLEGYLASGEAREMFVRLAVNQGASRADVERKNVEWRDKGTVDIPILAERAGVLKSVKTGELGKFLVSIGAGREKLGKAINTKVGVHSIKKVGSEINKGEPLCLLRLMTGETVNTHRLQKLFEMVSKDQVKSQGKAPLIHSWVRG